MPVRTETTPPPRKSKRKDSIAEILLSKHLTELGLEFEQEVRFHSQRKWRWDFALPAHKIAIEVDGYFQGRHGKGWGADHDKQNHGIMLGWRVLRFSTKDVLRGRAKAFLAELFGRQA